MTRNSTQFAINRMNRSVNINWRSTEERIDLVLYGFVVIGGHGVSDCLLGLMRCLLSLRQSSV